MPDEQELYEASPIKTRYRRGKVEVEALRQRLYEVVQEQRPMTVRQIYYQMVSRGFIHKTEAEYQAICHRLTEMRRSRSLPFHWIADNTRWMRKGLSHSSLIDALEHTRDAYRRSLWDNQDVYVEIWLEKDALSGVLIGVTNQWDVPLMVTRGYPSLSFLYSAAEQLATMGKPVYLYYLGDHDPSGVDIPRHVEAGIREWAPDMELHFERVAVLDWQIADYRLATRPTKRTDSRSKGFIGESVEVDALPPGVLREIVSNCIVQHIDSQSFDALKAAERSERKIVQRMIDDIYYAGINDITDAF